jgi:hypothetical protein
VFKGPSLPQINCETALALARSVTASVEIINGFEAAVWVFRFLVNYRGSSAARETGAFSLERQ